MSVKYLGHTHTKILVTVYQKFNVTESYLFISNSHEILVQENSNGKKFSVIYTTEMLLTLPHS